ncbi:MAG: hypothetical protein R3Y10_10930 [Ferrimonas sp.]
MKLKLTPLAVLCASLLLTGCSFGNGSSSDCPECPSCEGTGGDTGSGGDTGGNDDTETDDNNIIPTDMDPTDIDLYALFDLTESDWPEVEATSKFGTLTLIDGNRFSYFVSEMHKDKTDTWTVTFQASTRSSDELVKTATLKLADYFTNNPVSYDANNFDELVSAISEAATGDVILLNPAGDYNKGEIVLDKAITIEGNGASFTEDACFYVTEKGAAIHHINFNNSKLGTCSGTYNSEGYAGAITIDTNSNNAPVKLYGLNFDASKLIEVVKADSWVAAHSNFSIENSSFVNMLDSKKTTGDSVVEKNNAIFVRCGSTNARGSVIKDNVFSIGEISTSSLQQVGAIKLGNSSSGNIVSSDNSDCQADISGNEFNDYKTMVTAELSETSNRPAAIWTNDESKTDDYLNYNIFNSRS